MIHAFRMKLVLVLWGALVVLTGFPTTPANARTKCPVINGTFAMEVRSDGLIHTYTNRIYSRTEGDSVSYTIDKAGNYQKADGVARPYQLGERLGRVRLSCDGNSMIYESWADGSEKRFRSIKTPISRTELKIETTKEGFSGIYHRVSD